MNSVTNHVWQSTLFAALAAAIVFLLRRNRAEMRYRIWLAASIKFAVPFSLLVDLGRRVEWRSAPALPQVTMAARQVGQSFAPVAPYFSPGAAANIWPRVALAVWVLGAIVILARWIWRWREARAALRCATPVAIDIAVPVLSAPASVEPGVFGIFRPVLLVPDGIAARLSPAQWSAILAHEFCHVRRRDNLAAAFHMLVEAAFWWHPAVWWIGARLVEERERACDEEVLRQGSDAGDYAAGILNVCKFYIESPLACMSGVTGADLKKRVAAIMTWRGARPVSRGARLLIGAAGVAAMAIPMALGILHAQDTLKFDVISVKPADPAARGMSMTSTPGGGFEATNTTLRTLIEFAYNVRSFQISGGPDWLATERWVVQAKPDPPEPAPAGKPAMEEERRQAGRVQERTRTLLAERFHLAVRREMRELPVYHLVVAKGGHKLQPATEQHGITRTLGSITGKAAAMENLSMVLSFVLGRPVVDQTGLTDRYDFELQWSEEFNPGQIAKEKGIMAPPDAHPPEGAASDPTGPSIFTSIEKQLGLKLEAAKGPVEVIVIERADKPAAN